MNSSANTLPQLTFRAITLSMLLAVVLAAANTYLGLFAGLTIASAIPAAVVSMAVLKLLGGGHILENNIVQTGASAAASIAAGVIFTIPALVILGFWSDFQYLWVLAIAGLGGILGVLFSVPLRRALIVEQKLVFPEGKAAAEVLKTGENPAQGVRLLAFSATLGGIAKLLAASGARLIPDSAAAATYVGKGIAYFGTNLSPALLGVGYIVGLNIGIVVMAGGLISWTIAIPVFAAYFLDSTPELAARLAGLDAEAAAGAIWSAADPLPGCRRDADGWYLDAHRHAQFDPLRRAQRPGGHASGCVKDHRPHGAGHSDEVRADRDRALHAAAVRPLPGDRRQHRREPADGDHHDRRRIPVLLGVRLHGGPGRLLEQPRFGHDDLHHPVRLAGAHRAHGAGRSARTRRRHHDRRGGVLRGLGRGRQPAGPQGRANRRGHAVAAAGDAGDRRGVLRDDHGARAQPAREGVRHRRTDGRAPEPAARAAGDSDGLGGERACSAGSSPGAWSGSARPSAPQSSSSTRCSRKAARRYRAPVLAAAVGIYLPLELTVPIFLGGLLTYVVERAVGVGNDPDAKERLHRRGVLFSAGLITGEALMGIFIAVPIVSSGKADVLALPEHWQPGAWGELLGLAVLAVIAWFLFRAAISQAPAAKGK